ncbi:hypothetical protein CTRI78_v005423 [Colletotrichum trifolii]|uniref:Heparan-alpha-glucosaminide N-acetyltransferase catalytic domain-containing protein n=1 Tax=Colletotrichum trifolii TaxID=5466 RepID=A0A4R8RJ87_COLTR|nr:hypothetical protein CTRI78_v005423 [Colletotrichum trifolii]
MASPDANDVVAEQPAPQETAFTIQQPPIDEEAITPPAKINGHAHNTAANAAASSSSSSSSLKHPSPTSSSSSPRALAPDLLRGLLMLLMALDHNVIGLNAWPHSTGTNGTEADSAVVEGWNWWLGYAIRTLSHLCAPGFTFLLGMGVVYFGRSRAAKLGWSAARMARHFVVRGLVLTLVSVAMGLATMPGKLWFLNVVLVQLGVDYVLVGFLWLGISSSEPLLATHVDRHIDQQDGERRPLLAHSDHHTPSSTRPSHKASRLSFHIHNILLLVLSLVTIFWNHWLSPTHGTCPPPSSSTTTTITTAASPASDFWRFWFHQVLNEHVMSAFPPLAWLSFAILGLLYARILLARPSCPSTTQICGNLAAGTLFAALFVLTRVLRLGNLSEDCLRTPDQAAHPHTNPYLASPASFFYVVKYPPDFAFFCYTLAATFYLLALFAAVPATFANKRLRVLLAFGTSALFFYVAHMVLLMTLAGVLLRAYGRDTGVPAPVGRPAEGVDNMWLWWGNWLVVVAVMYPLCRWYGRFKLTRGPDSVWRFF